MSKANYSKIPSGLCCIMSVKEFIDCCDVKSFIDYDGFGHPMKDGKYDVSIIVKPSKRKQIPKDTTHILWFNR